ncbi:tetratricopeptide repeat protein [Streptomyces sp. DSM 44917]|uniref:Tetratricopeptide repeat protein n=1 Tax=Streptomyces boetiae TaxID=3075541 RepID=A0ABU2L6U9_9ACTN|nr:tetratricopeptide repeat protein [Streptomyces sp. DSM 44917]MDT0307284.1 tetratricopeptide repeat protein [Streptomyces sp. DSM 44917]
MTGQEPTNSVSGHAHPAAVIQASQLHGGVHLHQPGPPPLPVPRQLLPRPPHFVDRQEALAAVRSLRGPGAAFPLAALNVFGPGGVGKTALATVLLRDLAEEGAIPGGQLYADLRGGPEAPGPGQATVVEVLGRFLRAFGISAGLPSDVEERAALWRSVTAERRVAVQVDNAARAEDVRPLLPGSEGSLLVVTSRHRLTGLMREGALFHALAPLPQEAARQLLTRLAAGPATAHPVLDERAAGHLVAVCAGMPLALVVAGAHLAAGQPATLPFHHPSPSTPPESAQEAAINAVLDHTHDQLPAQAAAAYRTLGALPHLQRFGAHDVAAACGTPLDAAALTLGILAAHRLAEPLTGQPQPAADHASAAGWWRLHDAVHPHAAAKAREQDGPQARAGAQRRWSEYLLRTATAAETLISPSHRTLERTYQYESQLPLPFPDQDQAAALAWLEERLPDLMTGVETAMAAQWWDTTWQLVDALWPVFLRRRNHQLWVRAHLDLGLPAARRARHRAAERRMLTSGASGLRHLARYDEALDCFGQALALAEEDGDRRDEAQALNGTGDVHRLRGQYDQARDLLQQALKVREQIGYWRGAALTRVLLGDVALAQGDAPGAIGYLTSARATLLAERDSYDAARAAAFLARAHAAQGGDAQAERLFHQAVEEFTQAGSPLWQARALEWLGKHHQERGREQEARGCYQDSLQLYGQVHSRDAARLRTRLAALPPSPPQQGEPQ